MSSARQAAFPPQCVLLSGGRGIWGGATPPATQTGLRHECLPSIKNPLKMFKLVAKIIQSRGLEGVRAALGWLSGGPWVSPRSKAPLSSLLAAFWAALGRFLRRLRRLLGGSWAVLGTKVGRPGASWRHFGGLWLVFFTLRVLLYLRLSILVDFWIQNA